MALDFFDPFFSVLPPLADDLLEDFLPALLLRAAAAMPAAAATPATAAADARTFLLLTALAAAFLMPPPLPFELLEDDEYAVEEVVAPVLEGAAVSDPPSVPLDPFLLPVVAIESSFLQNM
ncbi:MAG TPA: hypothetical protein VGG03_13760 [Thermoanaerobaculia bacterium]